jgi:hypothetical protein
MQMGYGATMKVDLTPEQEAWLKSEIAAGHFKTPEAVISHAIGEAKLAALRKTLTESIARGGDNSAEDARRHVNERLVRLNRS